MLKLAMTSFVKYVRVDLMTGRCALFAKTTMRRKWRVMVEVQDGEVLDRYNFSISKPMFLDDVKRDLSRIVWDELKHLNGKYLDSAVCYVGV